MWSDCNSEALLCRGWNWSEFGTLTTLWPSDRKASFLSFAEMWVSGGSDLLIRGFCRGGFKHCLHLPIYLCECFFKKEPKPHLNNNNCSTTGILRPRRRLQFEEKVQKCVGVSIYTKKHTQGSKHKVETRLKGNGYYRISQKWAQERRPGSR